MIPILCETFRYREAPCHPSRLARSRGSRGQKGFSTIEVGQSTLVSPNAESDRGVWETQLADLKTELASRPVESLKDLLRLGEKVLADTGLDVGAGSRGVAGDAYESRLATRLARGLDSLSASSTGAEIRPADTQQLAADLQIFVRDTVRTVRSGRRLLRGTARRELEAHDDSPGSRRLLPIQRSMGGGRSPGIRDGDWEEDGLLACPNGRSFGGGNRSEPAGGSPRRSPVS